jgi:hypothetical protein
MRTYVMTTGVLFGLVTLAHVWRVLVEGLSLGLATDSALDAGVTSRRTSSIQRDALPSSARSDRSCDARRSAMQQMRGVRWASQHSAGRLPTGGDRDGPAGSSEPRVDRSCSQRPLNGPLCDRSQREGEMR